MLFPSTTRNWPFHPLALSGHVSSRSAVVFSVQSEHTIVVSCGSQGAPLCSELLGHEGLLQAGF